MEILYQDNRILVCIKPSGVVSTDEPGGMPQRIRDCLGDAHACVRTVHRLDAAVAGVMVLARSRMAAELLSEQVRARTFEKEYLAVLSGIPDAPEGTLRDLLFYDRASRTARVMPAPFSTTASSARRTAVRSSISGSIPAGRTRSGCSSPRAGFRCSATGNTARRKRRSPLRSGRTGCAFPIRRPACRSSFPGFLRTKCRGVPSVRAP